MFEQAIEEMTAVVHVDERESRLADRNGVTIAPGNVPLKWAEARDIARRIDHVLKSGLPYKLQENRLRALRNAIVWAFGPEAEERV